MAGMGVGKMRTKLDAVEMAVRAGIDCFIGKTFCPATKECLKVIAFIKKHDKRLDRDI